MSVWTKVKSKTLEERVDMQVFQEAIKDMNLSLDFSVTSIQNSYGSSQVDAMIRNNGAATALGVLKNSKGGLDVIGDTWRSGIVADKSHDKLINMLSQAYQKHKMKKDLMNAGWEVNTVVKDNKVILQCSQW